MNINITFWQIIFLITIFIVIQIIIYKILKKIIKTKLELKLKEIIKKERKEAISKSREVLTGLISEQLSPYLPNFPANPAECKFLGSPIDFVVFKGLENREVEEIIFIEIKSQNSKMSNMQKSIKKVIDEKKIKFIEYRI